MSDTRYICHRPGRTETGMVPTMILVIGDVTIRPDGIDRALALSREHVARSRTEPGCISHGVHETTRRDG